MLHLRAAAPSPHLSGLCFQETNATQHGKEAVNCTTTFIEKKLHAVTGDQKLTFTHFEYLKFEKENAVPPNSKVPSKERDPGA